MPNTIKLNPVTELRLVGVKNGKATFNEVYFNWETGNVLTVDEGTKTEDIISAYNEAGF